MCFEDSTWPLVTSCVFLRAIFMIWGCGASGHYQMSPKWQSQQCATPGKQPTTPGTVTARRWLCKNMDHSPDLCPDSVWKTLTPHPRVGCVSGVSTCNIYSSTSLCGGAELLQKWEMGWCSRTKAAAASCKDIFSAQTRLHSSLH